MTKNIGFCSYTEDKTLYNKGETAKDVRNRNKIFFPMEVQIHTNTRQH